MRINIVTVSSGWILQKIAQRTADHNTTDVTFTVGHSVDYGADVNYYVDLQNCYQGQKTNCDIAYFTHADQNSVYWLRQLFDNTRAYRLNGIVSMNKRYTDMLESIGYPAEKLITLVPGETKNQFPLKKVTIGVVSRGGYPGYGQQFIENFLQTYHCRNYKFKFLGKGWANIQTIARARFIDLEVIEDEAYENYPAFYQSIDYLLIPGLWTAGPMSMQEALSTGIPIIGADVGFVNYEFKADYSFEPNNVSQLISILDTIQAPILARRAQVADMTWEKYTTELVNFIKARKHDITN